MPDNVEGLGAQATRLLAMAEEADREGRHYAARVLRIAAAELMKPAARLGATGAMPASIRRAAGGAREEWPRPNARRPPR